MFNGRTFEPPIRKLDRIYFWVKLRHEKERGNITMDSNSTPASGDGMNPKEEEEVVEDDELSFMKRLKSAYWKGYCFQKDIIPCRTSFYDEKILYNSHRREFDANKNQSFPIVRGRDLDGGVKHYSFDELMQITDCFKMTDCFKSTTFVRYTMFGTLHRGTILKESGRQDVIIKTWEYFLPFRSYSSHNTTRIHDELNLLRVPEIMSHPNVVNLIGFHCERRLAVIYEGGSVQLLNEIIPSDTFSWKDRVKVATDMASMLEAFHDKGLVHGGIHCETVMVDKDKSPVVYDFRLFSYIEDQEVYQFLVKKHYCLHVKYLGGPPWSMKCDIFAYGILLLELINKKVYDRLAMPMPIWSKDEILNYDHKKSAVDDSLYIDEYIALGFTKLAINCLKVNLDEQPTIGDIVRELKDLMQCCPPNKLQKISY